MFDPAQISTALEIQKIGAPCLRRTAQPLSSSDVLRASTKELIMAMRNAMRQAPGVGLAAPQVGRSIQLAVIEDLPEYIENLTAHEIAERGRVPIPFHVIVNPAIEQTGTEQVDFFEGCLSVPDLMAVVPRFREVTVSYRDETGNKRAINATGWYARILQHEIDHMNGVLFVDRMRSDTLTTAINFERYCR